MLLLSDVFRDYLILFLEASFAGLGVLFAYVLIRHAVVGLRDRHEAQLQALYQPAVPVSPTIPVVPNGFLITHFPQSRNA